MTIIENINVISIESERRLTDLSIFFYSVDMFYDWIRQYKLLIVIAESSWKRKTWFLSVIMHKNEKENMPIHLCVYVWKKISPWESDAIKGSKT
jgi:hypothetical protein